MSELPAAETPRSWVLWLWAAGRAVWAVVIPGGWCLLMLTMVYASARGGTPFFAVLFGAGMWLSVLVIPCLAARGIWRVLWGERPLSERAMLWELRALFGLAVLVGMACVIVAPSFVSLMRFSHEGAMKGELGQLRGGVEAYKKAHEGLVPPSLEAVVAEKDAPVIGQLWGMGTKTGHEAGALTEIVSSTEPTDSGRWAYVVAPSSPDIDGMVFINCTHTDAKGSAWNAY